MTPQQFLELTGPWPEAMYMLSGDGRILAVNRSATRMLGISAQALCGQCINHLVEDAAEKVEHYLQMCLRSRALLPGKLVWKTEAGPAIECLCEGASVLVSANDTTRNIVLRCRSKETTHSKFVELNEELETLRNAHRQLMVQKEHLGEYVAAKTADLAQANAALEQEMAERQRTQEKLRRSEAHFRSLIENGTDIITIMNTDGTIRYESPSIERVLGYQQEELVGKNAFEFVHLDDVSRVHSAFNDITNQANATITVEYRFRHRNGAWRVLESRGKNLLEDPAVAGVVINSRDITERKETEIALRESERALATSMEVSRRLSRILDENQLVSAIVQEIGTAFDYYYTHVYLFDQERQNLVLVAGSGTVGQATVARDHKIPRGKGLVGKAADTDEIVLVPDVSQDEAWLPHPLLPDVKSEVEVPITIGGRVLGVLGVQHNVIGGLKQEDADLLQSLASQIAVALENARLYEQAQHEIKERQLAEATLQNYTAKLEQSNQELVEFAYIASHDLQEPLRKVTAFGSRLQAKYGDALGEKGLDYLNRMINASERMQTLINGLLDYSRVTTKARPFEPVDLTQVATEVLSDLEMRLQDVNGRVEIDGLPTLQADPLQMRQLLQNLIGNALKFNKPGEPPVVKVTARYLNGQAGRLAEISDKAHFYEIDVADNGIGFDESYADRIFGVFQRLHGHSEYEGSGIGLAICKKIVERHGGVIAAQSAPGQGATFKVVLPAK